MYDLEPNIYYLKFNIQMCYTFFNSPTNFELPNYLHIKYAKIIKNAISQTNNENIL